MKGAARYAAVVGAALYEFRMQARRKALWVVMVPFALYGLYFFPLLYFPNLYDPNFDSTPLARVVAGWALALQSTAPIAVGIMLADRLPRDGRIGVEELLETLPARPGERLLGKFLGATLATIAPLFLAHAAVLGYVAATRGDLGAFPLGLLAFAAVNLPGLLFVAAFSVSCPAVMWVVPLYQFLFVGYWLWGNGLSPEAGIPTLSGTILTPLGENAAHGFFAAHTLFANDAGPRAGAASVCLLLGLGALALLCAHLVVRRKKRGLDAKGGQRRRR